MCLFVFFDIFFLFFFLFFLWIFFEGGGVYFCTRKHMVNMYVRLSEANKSNRYNIILNLCASLINV